MLHSTARDKDSQKSSIKDMSPSPSPAELLERARECIREWRYVARGEVKAKSERLHDEKREGDDEQDGDEYVAPSVLELAKIVKSPMSRVKDLGDDGRYWSLTVEGPDSMGNRVIIFLMLPKDVKGILQIGDFQIIP